MMLVPKTRNKVLIVEDSPSINMILSQKITSKLHIDVESAFTLEETKSIMEKGDPEYLAAVLDLNLPDAENGEVVDYILEKGIPPIILTGSISDDLHDEMMEKPIIDYVVKRNLNEIDYVLDTIKRLKDNINRKILIVDDSKSSRLLMKTLLQRHYYNVIEANNGIEALRMLETHNDITLVITDYNMPEMDGTELCTKIREHHSRHELAIIGISTTGCGSVTVKLLKSGANDFISRPFLHEEFYCRVNQNIDAIVSYRELRDAANKDFLTGLNNRKYLYEMGEVLFKNAKRKNINLAVATIDVDFFKNINDTYGHHTGDIALNHIAQIFTGLFREADVIARTGGEEFCLICVNIDKDNAGKMFERLRSEIMETPLLIDGLTIPMTISIGYTMNLTDTFDHMLQNADTALYQAKSTGRNKVTNFNDCWASTEQVNAL
jgi:diguanylate cyclase (GGDEF)-like protein